MNCKLLNIARSAIQAQKKQQSIYNLLNGFIEKNMKKKAEDYREFKIHGAGVFRVSKSAEWVTGPKKLGIKGLFISIDYSGKFSGGVLTKNEAINLANHIYDVLDINKVELKK